MSSSTKKKYSPKSDGSPETIEYRNKVATGEIKKLGRPFLTAEERAESAKRRKDYLQTYKSKRKRKRRKYEMFLPYDEARERIQLEGVRSAAEYTLWHRLNHPAQMPQSPEDFYARRGSWISWGHFLGTNNTYPRIKKKNWRPYKEAKAYAHTRDFSTVPEWIAFCKAGGCPDDIPHRPDVAYFKSGHWFSWREFLGPKCKIELGKAIEVVNDKVLYILQVPNPQNQRQFRIGVTVGGWSSIADAVQKYNLRFVKAFIIEADFEWKNYITQFGDPVWDAEGIYELRNVNELVLSLSQYFIEYRKDE